MTGPDGFTPRSLLWSSAPLKHEAGEHEAGPPRLCEFLEARPALPHKARLIEDLKRRIHGIERHLPVLSPVLESTLWTTGAFDIDACLGISGLNAAAVHEIKPATAGAAPAIASMGFALRLAARRLQQLKAVQPDDDADDDAPRILWCVTRNSAHETGELYGPGLAALGLDPACFLIIETARASETLWAMEEGLKSASLALVMGQPGVMGQSGVIGLTPARRLSLAAKQASTPCLLLTPHQSPAAAATSTRWRLGPAPSTAHRFDARAPGRPRFTATLERCQHHLGGEPLSFVLEWPHAADGEAHRVRVAAALAHRTPHSSQHRHCAG